MPELTIKTAKTKEFRNVHLAARTLEREDGEKILSLLRIDGREKECQQFIHEWMNTVERTLSQAEEAPYERMEGALKELNGLLKAIQLSDHIDEVNAILGLFDRENILHVSQAGRAEGYLTRDNSTVQITEHQSARGGTVQFLFISSGDLKQSDVVLLSTERLLRSITPAQLTQAARRPDELLETICTALEGDKEAAACAMLSLASTGNENSSRTTSSKRTFGSGRSKFQFPALRMNLRSYTGGFVSILAKVKDGFHELLQKFQSDLQHPTKKRKAHFLLLAGALIVFIGVWAGFQVMTASRRNQSRTELTALMEKINADIVTSENRQIMGDGDSANAILNRAEEEARSVMQNESGLFRTEALDLLDRIREKREAISNIIRLTPTLVANLTTRSPDIAARGLVGIERGRLIVYDRQNIYSIIVNAVDEPERLDGENLILDGTIFPRFDTTLFMTKENRLIELIDGQPTAMKTDDPAGWLSGPDIETYIRYLYVLSPQNNQILKYERLSNRYSAPTEYNVNGNLADAIDMVIDSDLYVLKSGGEVVKLFRGESRPFTIRNLPTDALKTATKIVKPSDRGNFYFLDPEGARIIVARTDDDAGESLYLKQYVLEGEQVGILQDLYVDSDETQLIVLDEKRVYSINLQEE